MHELILRDYFVGLVNESVLKEDLKGNVIETSHNVFSHKIVSIDTEFEVIPAHLAKLCDGVLSGKLQANDLETIGFCLAATDYFMWDGDTKLSGLVADTVYDWASPEINYPLTIENIKKFRERLLTEKDVFTENDTR